MGDEAVVAGAVDGGGEAEAHGADVAVGVLEGQVLGAAARGVGTAQRVRVVFGGDAAGGEQGDAGREQERAAGAGQGVADGRDGGAFGAARAGVVGEVVLEREVDDRVGGRGAGAEAVQVVEAAVVDLGAGGGDGGGRGVRAGQAEDVVAGGDELGEDGGPDPARCSGDEHLHEKLLSDVRG
ncbi:hypothetical protein GCM10027610_123990 [Dactylosporangium cerinum]